MTAPTHIVFGLVSALGAVELGAVSPGPIHWLLVIVGSLAPDIDSDRSTISKPGYFFRSFSPKLFTDLINVFFSALAKIIQSTLGHRGALHWPVTGLLIMSAGYFFDLLPLLWFGFGYLSHILADFCTKGGIKLFAPLQKKTYRWSKIRTGSYSETVVFVFLLVAMVVLGINKLPGDPLSNLDELPWLNTY